MIAKYGPDFAKGDYGWAGHHLRKNKPIFKDIEAAVDIGHFRAHYRLASHKCPCQPEGRIFKLEILPESQVLLAGPGNAGLADPGHGTAISLSRVIAALVKLQQPPTLDNHVALLMMVQLVDEIGEPCAEPKLLHRSCNTSELSNKQRLRLAVCWWRSFRVHCCIGCIGCTR